MEQSGGSKVVDYNFSRHLGHYQETSKFWTELLTLMKLGTTIHFLGRSQTGSLFFLETHKNQNYCSFQFVFNYTKMSGLVKTEK
jgi:hypothetical protein